MKTVASQVCREDRISYLAILLTLILAPFLPEYIAPVMTIATFVIFKVQSKKQGRRVQLGSTGKMAFVYMCYMVVTALWSDNPIMSVLIGLLWMGMFLGDLTIANLATDEKRLDTLVYFAVLGGALVGGLALVQIVTIYAHIQFPNPFWSQLDAKVLGGLPFDVNTSFVTQKPGATFTNSLIFGTFMLMLFPFSIYSTVTQKGGRKWVSGFCVLIYFCAIAATYSRGAYLAIIAALVVLMFIGRKYALNIAIAFVGVLAVMPASVFKRFDQVDLVDGAVSERFAIWDACFDIIRERFLLGIGAGSDNLHVRLVEDFGVRQPHAHNLYLEMMVEGGIVGIILLAAVLAFVLRDSAKIALRGGKWRVFGLSVISSAAGIMVMSLTEFTLQTPKELQVFMVVLGFLEAGRRICARERAPSQGGWILGNWKPPAAQEAEEKTEHQDTGIPAAVH